MLPLHHDPGTRSEACVSIVVSSCLFSVHLRPMARGGVEPPLPPYQSDMLPLQHRALQSGWPESNCAVSCSRRTRVTITLHPETNQNGRIRTGGLLDPDQADFQALLRSETNSSSGNRTPSSALKGQHPGPVDERAVCAQRVRKWVGWCSFQLTTALRQPALGAGRLQLLLQVFSLALNHLSYRPVETP